MFRHNRLRLLAAGTLLVLALSPAVGQAGTAPTVATMVPLAGQPDTAQLDHLVRNAQPVSSEPDPRAGVDRGLQAMGGLAGYAALHQSAAKAPATAATAPAVAKPAAPELHQVQVTAPDQRLAKAVKTASAATVKPTAPASARAHVDTNLMQPRTAVQSSVVKPLYAAGTYNLDIDKDVFALGETATVNVHLTENGTPVAGATVLVDYGGPAYTTDPSGNATFAYTAPQDEQTITLLVTTATVTDLPIGELYAVRAGDGVLVVSDVTDQNGNPVGAFDVFAYNSGGYWGRNTDSGRLSMIVQSGANDLELASRNGTNLFLYQPLNVPPGGKAFAHPSGTQTVALSVRMHVDGVERSGPVFLHNMASGYPSAIGGIGNDAYVTPGTYTVVEASGDAPAVALARTGIDVMTATTLDLSAQSNELAHIDFWRTDGHGAAFNPDYVILRTSDTEFSLPGGISSLLVQSGPSFQLVRYGTNLTAGDYQWTYWFWGDNRSPFNLPIAGYTYQLRLGGSVFAGHDLYTPCLRPGCQITVYPQLATPDGDFFQAGAQYLPTHDWQFLSGSLSLMNSVGTQVVSHHVDPNVWQDQFTLPVNACGTWQVNLDYPDLGPYQSGAYHKGWPFQVETKPNYYLSYSQTMLDPNTTANVTLVVGTDNGPAAGLELHIGYGGRYGVYTTGDNGGVSFGITTGWREEIPIETYVVNFGWVRLGYLYVVPQGYGVVYVDNVLNRNSQPVDQYHLSASWFDPPGGYDLWQSWSNTAMGMVRPAGQNYLELAAQSGSEWYYIYQPVNVFDHQYQDLTLGAWNAVPVNAALTIDGAPATDFSLRLHNQNMSGWTSLDGTMPAQNLWATPGYYTLEAELHRNSLMVLTDTAQIINGSSVNLAATTESLATLQINLTDAAGNPLDAQGMGLRSPAFSQELGATRQLLVTPGIQYYISSYDLDLTDTDSSQWHYRFEHRRQDAPTYTPLPGQVINMNPGGPLHAHLAAMGSPIAAGSLVPFETELLTGNNEGAYIDRNHMMMDATLTLTDAQGNVWLQQTTSPWQSMTYLPMPSMSGNYTLSLAYETGPYQGKVVSTLPLVVTNGDRVDLTLSQKSVPVGQPADITVTATRDGQPVSGLEIYLDWYGSQFTDAAGKATFHVNESWSTVLTAVAWNGPQQLGAAILFVLQSDEAGVEIGGTDSTGHRLMQFDGSAEVQYDSGASKWTGYARLDLAGAIVPAGQANIELTQDGPVAYLLNTSIYLTAGNIYTVILDGTQAAAVPLDVSNMAGPLTGGLLALHTNRSLFSTFNSGLQLDSTGHGVYYVTPVSGGYRGFVRYRSGEQAFAVQLGAINPGNGGYAFTIDSADLGLFQFRPTFQGQPISSGDTAIRLNGGFFEFPATANDLFASPGTYLIDELDFLLPQSNGENWSYETRADKPVTIQATAGQAQYYPWALDNMTATVNAKTFSYQPGSMLQYELHAVLAGQFTVRNVYRNPNFWEARAPISAQIRDAAGNVVHTASNLSYWDNYWPVPTQNPSTSYTVEMNRDLGALGTATASAVYKLWTAPPQPAQAAFRLDRELLMVGQNNLVRAVLAMDGQPVKNAWVLVQGETAEWRQTDGRGELTVTIKPTRAGTWTFTYSTPTTYARGAAYALAPGWGLVDMQASDENGLPLAEFYMTAIGNGMLAAGAHIASEQTKMVVPAGRALLVARGRKLSGENYYLTTAANVPSMGSITVPVTAMTAARINLFEMNTPAGSKSLITLRSKELPYLEWSPLPNSLQPGKGIYVSPGSYEALVQIADPANATQRLMAIPDIKASRDVLSIVMVNVNDASVKLDVSATGANGQAGSNAELQVSVNSAMAVVPLQGSQVYVSPGTYEILGGAFDLADPGTPYRYRYHFAGHATVAATAGGGSIPFALGGPLTASLQTEQQQALVNGAVTVHAAARTGNGLYLAWVDLTDNVTGQPRGWIPNVLWVNGNGYSRDYPYSGDTVTVNAPPQAGTCQLKFSAYTGPYGTTSPTASGTVQVIRLTPRRP